jgi:cell division protein FtsA
MSKYVAIDLGSSKISALAAEVLQNGVLKVLGVESKSADDIKHGVVEQVSGAAFKVNEVLRLLQNSAKLPEIDLISVSIGAKSMKSVGVSVNRFIGSSQKVSESLIEEMHAEVSDKVKREGIAVYDVIPLYYELDGVRTDEPEGQSASQIIGKYTVVYGSSVIQAELDRCFDRTGIKVEFSPIAVEALSAALLDDEKRENGCALIDFGASTTTLSIFYNGALESLLVVPLGGKNITRDIQELGISEQNAEKLKLVKGNALERMELEPICIQIPALDPESEPIKISTKFLATIIEARLDELLMPIIDVLDVWKDKIQGGIVITGGASKLKNIDAYLLEKTELECQIGCHSDWIEDEQIGLFGDICLSQLLGTIILNQEYRELHPLEETKKAEKKPKIPKGNLKNKITR